MMRGVGLCLFAMGCASMPSGAPPGAPDWVLEGSGARDGRFYGLGSVSGVRNTSLARSTAANRARAEISRILQVYSASLMRDFQASTRNGSASDESQRVEQAIKTYSQSLLNGSVIDAYWFDGARGTWYALASLDPAATPPKLPQLDAFLSSRPPDAMQTLESELDRAFGRTAASVAPQGVPENEGPEVVESAGLPSWALGACPPGLMCGVGTGKDVAGADAAARAELGRIFVAEVQAVQESFERANQRTRAAAGEDWVEVQSVSQSSLVSTDKVIRFSRIESRARAQRTHYALAVIDRAQAASALRAELTELDARIRELMGRADAAGRGIERFRALRGALQASAQREAVNADLATIAGSGESPAVPVASILAALDEVQRRLQFSLRVEGPGAASLRACISEALNERGYDVTASEGSAQVAARGVVTAVEEGRVGGQLVVAAELSLELVDLERGETFGTARGQVKTTRSTFARAVSTAVFKLCQGQVPDMIDLVESHFQ